MTEERTPPQSIEAEMSTLGAMLIDPDCFHKISDMLNAEDFTREAHRVIFASFVALFTTGRPVDIVTLRQFIDDMGQAERVTYTYLASLTSAVPTSSNIVHYARIVKDKSIRRRLLSASMRIMDTAYDEEKELEGVLAESQNKVFEITPFKTTRDDANAIVDEVEAVQKEYDQKYREGKKLLGFSCGMDKLDDIIDGMRPGHVWVVGAWTSTGKTQFALNIVHSVLEQAVPVSIISLEMSRVDTIARLIGIRANISSMRVLKGKNETKTAEAIEEAKIFMRWAPLEVHTTYFDLEKIRAIIRRDVFARGVKLVVVDYVQNIVSEKAQKEYEVMTRAATSLQALARELNITIYLVSQVSNDAEKGVAAGAGFKGSGALEAVADIAIRLKRKRDEEKIDDEYVPVAINVTKNRHGITCTFANHFMWLKSGKFEYMPNAVYISRDVAEKINK